MNRRLCPTRRASRSSLRIRLITDLGYTDAEIKPKTAIDAVRVPRGRKRELYKPDYLLVCAGQPRWLVEVKATDERIEDFTLSGSRLRAPDQPEAQGATASILHADQRTLDPRLHVGPGGRGPLTSIPRFRRGKHEVRVSQGTNSARKPRASDGRERSTKIQDHPTSRRLGTTSCARTWTW